MKFKKVLMVNLVLSLMLVFALTLSVGADVPTPDNPITLDVGHILSPESIQNQALKKIKEKVEERTNGAVKIEIFPAEQLGHAPDQFENVSSGVQAMVLCDTPWMQIYSDRLKLNEIPFLFSGHEHLNKWFDTVFDEEIHPQIIEKGNMRMLTKDYRWNRGPFMVMVSKKPVFKPEDVTDLKMRLWPSETVVESWKAIGANVSIIDYSEVYLALQYGTVDALTTPITLVYPQKFTEVAKYVTEVDTMPLVECLLINNDIWNKLSSEQQTIMQKSIDETGKWYNTRVYEAVDEYKEKIIKEHGASYIQINREPFIKITQEKVIPQLIEQGIIEEKYVEEVEKVRP